MTPEEAGQLVAGHRIARHRGLCFFTTYSQAEAREWRERGARVRDETPDGRFCAEVYLHPLLAEPTEADEDGNVIANRAAIMLDSFRERDGYETAVTR